MWKPARTTDYCPVGMSSFSPLAGISYVETATETNVGAEVKFNRFSPLAGISYVETILVFLLPFARSVVSVPLRGLVMWKHLSKSVHSQHLFQSPCGD